MDQKLYNEILACYNHATDIQADIAYKFEIYDDFYYSLFSPAYQNDDF